MANGIYEAIVNTMKDVGIVGKNDKNDYDKYAYRGIDAVMNALNPAMIKNGIFVVPTVLEAKREERQGNNKTMMYSVLTVKYTFYAKDGSSIESVVVGEAMDRSDKSTNKAMSAAFKYACFQTFCIPTEEMHDSEEESLDIGKKTDEQKNKEMIESVDQSLVPGNTGGKEEWIKKIKAEMDRTGIEEAVVLKGMKLKSLDDLTEAQYIATMNTFAKKGDKKK